MATVSRAVSFLSDLRRGCTHYGVPYLGALTRSIHLHVARKFSPKEIIGYGLFVPSIRRKFPVLISKEGSLAKLGLFNPPELQHLTESKDVFYAKCRKQGLPIPDTFGWTNNGSRFDAEGQAIASNDVWSEYLLSRLPKDFIIKDRTGTYGSGFRAFCRAEGSFQCIDSRIAYDRDAFLRALSVNDASGIIIQARLFDAAPLTALSGRRGLQTMRVNTLLQQDGSVDILFYMLKVLAGTAVSDNFSMGASGNLIAYGDPDEGILRGAVNIHECGCGMKTLGSHPETGVPFDGFRIPHWKAAIELAKVSQRCFPELPMLGWDIALTENGPVIIEANSRWDPPLYAPFLMSETNWRRVFLGENAPA